VYLQELAWGMTDCEIGAMSLLLSCGNSMHCVCVWGGGGCIIVQTSSVVLLLVKRCIIRWMHKQRCMRHVVKTRGRWAAGSCEAKQYICSMTGEDVKGSGRNCCWGSCEGLQVSQDCILGICKSGMLRQDCEVETKMKQQGSSVIVCLLVLPSASLLLIGRSLQRCPDMPTKSFLCMVSPLHEDSISAALCNVLVLMQLCEALCYLVACWSVLSCCVELGHARGGLCVRTALVAIIEK
jgi:hypothetical protein